jgi:integrase
MNRIQIMPLIMEAGMARARQGNGVPHERPDSEESVATEGLSDALVRGLLAPASGSRITYDRGPDRVRGFGCRVTAAGTKAFVLNYTVAGRERRMTIGEYPTWRVATARAEAKKLRQEIDRGVDPLGERIAEREAPTVTELCDRYLAEHAVKKRDEGRGDAAMIRLHVLPALRSRKVTSIAYADVDRLHRKLSATAPYQANRLAALLSKMFSLAIRWQMRPDNPCKGVERNHEEKRSRYLSSEELRRLTEALAVHPSKPVANAVRLLLLTGGRKTEVLAATWDQFDLAEGVWVKPSSHTKQKREHRVPLSAPARQLLVEMRAEAGDSRFLFPARSGGNVGHLTEIKKSWAALCKAAGISGFRIHDLRHSYASFLASAGLSLPVIGALLGHSQVATTQRYSHLFDDPLRAATERVGAIVAGSGKAEGAEVVDIGGRGRR